MRDPRLRRRADRRPVLVGRGRPRSADEPTWVFAQVPEPKAGKNGLHLDGYTWTRMADPEGNEFDIARQS